MLHIIYLMMSSHLFVQLHMLSEEWGKFRTVQKETAMAYLKLLLKNYLWVIVENHGQTR
jgi:hypothetical protein